MTRTLYQSEWLYWAMSAQEVRNRATDKGEWIFWNDLAITFLRAGGLFK